MAITHADMLVRAVEPALIHLGREAFDSVPRIITSHGTGSGVVWSPDGLVVTNSHVVAHGPIRAAFPGYDPGYDPVDAQLVANDPSVDLALLRLDIATLGASGPLKPIPREAPPVVAGRLVVAVGNPLGLRRVLTLGIVVAANAHPVLPGDADHGGLIQTDVTLAPGNSGGALLDSRGRLVGINTLVMGRASFAIPVTLVESFVETALRATYV